MTNLTGGTTRKELLTSGVDRFSHYWGGVSLKSIGRRQSFTLA